MSAEDTKRVPVNMPQQLVGRVDRYRGTLPDVPDRSEAIRRMLDEFLTEKGLPAPKVEE